MPRLPLRWLVKAAGGRRSSELPSADRQPPRAVRGKQRCYSSSWAYRSFGRFRQVSTHLDTPPFSLRHHPVSAIAPKGVVTVRDDRGTRHYTDVNRIELWLVEQARQRGYGA